MATKAILVCMAGYPLTPASFFLDNGLAQLAACLVGDGHDVRIVDLNTTELMERLFPRPLRREGAPLIEAMLTGEPDARTLERYVAFEERLEAHRLAEFDRMGSELAELVRRERASWVGFKLWNGDAYTGSDRMARALKRALPDLPVIAGGPQVDFFAELLPRIGSGFDYFSIGEGEPTVTAFARFVEGTVPLGEVPNLLLKGSTPRRTPERRVEDLDALPLPLYDESVYAAAFDPGKVRAGTYEETRGCPYRCAFCNHPLKAGRRMRTKDVARAAAEIAELKSRYGQLAFKLGGSYTPAAYMRRLAERLIADEVGVDFCAYGRISDARPEDFALYRRAGCRALFFGVETGSQLLLDEKIHKRYRAEHCATILRACKEAGIATIASLVYPNPGETAESRRATLELMADVRPDGAPVHFAVLVPGSGWWHEPERYGFEVPDREAYLRQLVGYKARLMFPPRYWPPLAYRIDGKPFGVYAEETAAMTREIEALGVVTLISDDAAMVAAHSGLSLRAFRDLVRRLVVTGDAAGMQSLVDAVNVNLAMLARPERAPAGSGPPAPHPAPAPAEAAWPSEAAPVGAGGGFAAPPPG